MKYCLEVEEMYSLAKFNYIRSIFKFNFLEKRRLNERRKKRHMKYVTLYFWFINCIMIIGTSCIAPLSCVGRLGVLSNLGMRRMKYYGLWLKTSFLRLLGYCMEISKWTFVQRSVSVKISVYKDMVLRSLNAWI